MEQITVFLEKLFSKAGAVFSSPLFQLGGNSVSVESILALVLALALVVLVSRWTRNFLKENLLAKAGMDRGNREAISTIASYLVAILGILVSVQSIGFNLASLAVVVGGLGVGIGFGLQDITNNFISGLILLIYRPIKVGDYIEWQWMESTTLKGIVRDISLRSTIVTTTNGGDVVLPNSQLVGNQILNWSYENFQGQICIPVQISEDSDTIAVIETLLNSAYMQPDVLYDPSPKVNFLGSADGNSTFELLVWVERIDQEDEVKNYLNLIIDYNLRQQGLKGRKTDSPPAATISIRDLLRKVIYFQNFSDLQLLELIEVGYRKRLLDGDTLFKENDPGDAFYIILTGSVEVYVEKLNKHLATLEAGKFFGELALMLGIPRSASVRAVTDTVLFAINDKGFKTMLRENPDLYEIIVRELAKHQEELTQRQEELRKLGLLDAKEDEQNPVTWMRNRLKKLFCM
ncbi:MAG TPA: mechanosensitive ion channel [Oscillatoriaceae cyanobacterium M33_DOE_052]|uniref:Mechanosensitive ion channel n=1 Tax=Planktothricoides sp. SpSt-374 TaxID=2282167 RepID=A0A7C3VVI3_9CYAN|nr:mechanosensitive ion channel [Oscillatoriaceae cyanobacterium M33_DOE_052]